MTQTTNSKAKQKSVAVRSLGLALGLIGALVVSNTAQAAPSKSPTAIEHKSVTLKVAPINSDLTEAELLKKQESRAHVVDQALDQALKEQAQSRSAFERTQARMADREARVTQDSRSLETRLDLDSRETRSQMQRELREERLRERRLNWLND